MFDEQWRVQVTASRQTAEFPGLVIDRSNVRATTMGVQLTTDVDRYVAAFAVVAETPKVARIRALEEWARLVDRIPLEPNIVTGVQVIDDRKT